MIKFILYLVIGLFLIGCGDIEDVDKINEYKSKNELGYYGTFVIFSDKTISGFWSQYEYDDNGDMKQNELGIEFKYQFMKDGNVQMNISIIDQWIPLGIYGVNAIGTEVVFEEGDKSVLIKMETLELMDDGCIKIAKYKIQDNNTTFDKNYHLCKDFN